MTGLSMVLAIPPNALTECVYDPLTLFVRHDARRVGGENQCPLKDSILRARARGTSVPRAGHQMSPRPWRSASRRSRRRVSRRGDRARDPRVARSPPGAPAFAAGGPALLVAARVLRDGPRDRARVFQDAEDRVIRLATTLNAYEHVAFTSRATNMGTYVYEQLALVPEGTDTSSSTSSPIAA